MPADPHGKPASQTTTLPNLHQALEQSGEKAALKEYVQGRLLASGWRDDLKQHAIEYIKSKGTEKVRFILNICPIHKGTLDISFS